MVLLRLAEQLRQLGVSRCFFVNQSGDVLSCRNSTQRYSGATKPATGLIAISKVVSTPTMASTIAANVSGQDDEVWTVVN